MTFDKYEFPEDKIIELENGEKVTIKQYIPMVEKLKAIQSILELSLNVDTGMYLPAHIKVYADLYTFYLYTDIEFTQEQKDDPMTLYDNLLHAPWYKKIKDALLFSDIFEFNELLNLTREQFEKYQTSAYGIFDSLKKDYDNLNFNLEELQKNISDKKNIELVDKVITKLG